MSGLDLAPFWLSLRVASLATGLVLLAGTPLALLLARGRFVGKSLLAGLLLLPLVLPPTVLGFGLLEILGRRGPLGSPLERWLGLVVVFHWTGAVIASAVAALPLYLVAARGALEAVDPDLENAARLLGRGELAVLRHITLPLAWRGLAAGALLAFARALGDFGATLMVAGDIPGRTRTAALAIYNSAQVGDTRQAFLMSVLTAGLGLAAVLLVQACSRRRDRDAP